MTHECPAVVWSQNSFAQKGMDMQIISEVVLGITTVILPAACQLSVRKDCTECPLQVVYSGRGGGESVSLLKVLFPSCPGYFCKTVSLLPHLTVQICYVIVNITNSAYHMNTLCIGSAFMKY